MLAVLVSGIICTAACVFFGFLVPTWLVGQDTPDSPYTGQVFSVALSFASAYSLLGFILLTVYFHGRLSAWPAKETGRDAAGGLGAPALR
jgi:hypothetical protein